MHAQGPERAQRREARKPMRLRRCAACHFGMICEIQDEMLVSCGNRPSTPPVQQGALRFGEAFVANASASDRERRTILEAKPIDSKVHSQVG